MKNASTAFLGLGYIHFSEKKLQKTRKVENLVRFLSNCEPYFSNIQRARKMCKMYIESTGIYCKNIETIESMEVTTIESNAFPFHFA